MRKNQRERPITDPRRPAADDASSDSPAAGSPSGDIAADAITNTINDGPFRVEGSFTTPHGELVEAVSDIDEFQDDDPGDQEPGAEEAVSDDPRWLEGIVETPITSRYEKIAVRDDLAEKFESLVADVSDWLLDTDDPDAQGIYDDLRDLAERVGRPLDETEAEPDDAA